MPPPPRHLFVYGTLRPALASGESRRLIHGLHVTGNATVPGRLYDLGDYPGLTTGDGLVHGDVLEIDQPERLAALDAYEECGGPQPLFYREESVATFPDGQCLPVWIYRYGQSIQNAQLLPHGDYARQWKAARG